MSKYITHILRLKKSKGDIDAFQNLIKEGLGKKLSFFLFQFPPSFQYTEENLEELVKNIPHIAENVVEFRHVSWWNQNVKKAFKASGVTFCNVDYPGLKTPFINTSSLFYLRLLNWKEPLYLL